MPRLSLIRRSTTRRALMLGALPALALLSSLSCGEITGPGGGVRVATDFSFSPRFARGLVANGVASDLAPYDRVRVRLLRTNGAAAFDRMVSFPANATSVPLTMTVELDKEAPPSGEAMTLKLAYVNTAGDTVFSGTTPVTVAPTERDGEPPAPVDIDVDYTGPGASATAVVISPNGSTVVAGSPFTFTAVAQDAQQQTIGSTPIAWSSLDPVAVITAPGAGAGTTIAGRGTARIVAQLLNGPADTVLLTVNPLASTITRVSGNSQSATVGTTLPQPVVVRVLATDNQPMAGVTVTFAAQNGGTVGTPSAVTDANGQVQTTWTLGAADGAQTLTATSAGLNGSPLSFSATAVATGPDRLMFGVEPTHTTAGVAIAPAVTVRMEDANGVLRTNFTGNITIAIGDNPGDDALNGTLTVAAVAGIATFSDLSITTAADEYSLMASAAGVADRESQHFDINPGPGAELHFEVEPTGSLENEVISPAPRVRVVDAYGNLAVGYVGNVSMQFENTTAAILGGTLSVAVFEGYAEFDDLTVNQTGTYSLRATAPGLTSATSVGFNIAQAGVNALAWTNPAGGNWNNPANWSEGRVPAAGDSVVIALDGTYTVTLDVSPTVNALVVGGGSGTRTLSFPARQLTVNSTLAVLSNGGLLLTNGAVLGGGTLRNEGTVTMLQGSLSIANVDNDGLIIARDASSISGTLTTTTLSVIRVLGASGTGTGVLTVANTFMNLGLIELTSIDGGFTATMNVTNGWLENMAGATITTLAGAGGGRNLNVRLVNRGTLVTPVALTVARASSSHSNELGGVIDVTGGDLHFTQSGTSPSFVNLGVINLSASRNLSFSGGVLNTTSGFIEGVAGALNTSNMTLLFTPERTRTQLALATTTVPGTVTVPAGDTLRLVGGGLAAPVENNGIILVRSVVTITGAITTNPGSLIRVLGASGFGSAALTVNAALINSTAIELTSVNGGFASSLTVTGGLTNTATGTITSLVGAGGGRTLNAQLDNQGTITTPAALTLARPDAQHVNSGTINVSAANLTVTQTGTGAPSFTNTGTIALSPSRTLSISGGQITLTGGQLTGGFATLSTSNATLAFTTASARVRLNLVNTTVPGTFTVPAADSIVLAGGSPTFTLVNNGLIIAQDAVTLNGSLTSTVNDTLRLRGASGYGTSALTLPFAYTNHGTIEMTSIDGGFATSLTVTGGLTNAATGRIRPLAGFGGSRTIVAQLTNLGNVSTAAALTLARPDAAHVNSGTIDITAANLTVTQTGGAAPSFTNTGTITMAAGRTMSVSGGQINMSGGTLTGGAATLATSAATLDFTTTSVRARLNLVTTLVPGTFTIPLGDSIVLAGGSPTMAIVNNGTVITQDAVTFTGSFSANAGSTLRLRGASGYGTSAFTTDLALVNNGTIEFTSIDGGFATVMTVNGGLTNSPTGAIVAAVGAGGSRTLSTQLNNQGAILLPAAMTLTRPGAQHTSSGTIGVSGGDLTITQTGATPSFANTGIITLAGGRTMNVSGGALVLTGGQVNGGTATLSTTGTTLTFTTPEARTRLTLATTTVPGTFTVPAGDSIVLAGGSPTMTIVNQGRIIAQDAMTFSGSITSATPAATLMLRGASGYGTANFTYNGTLTNSGIIDMTSIEGGFATVLAATGGVINMPSGVINALAGVGGQRTINASLDNRGIVNLPNALTLNGPSADHVNSGTINSTTGNLILLQNGTTPSFTNLPGGVINLSATRMLVSTTGVLDLTQGLVQGGEATVEANGATFSFTVPTVRARIRLGALTVVPHTVTVPVNDSIVFVDAGLNAPLVNNGLVIAQGATTLGGPVTTGPGSIIRARGASGYGTSALTITDGFTNTERIELTSIEGGFASSLTVTNGTLVNAAGGVIDAMAGAGGGRTLAAQLDNQGTVTVSTTSGLTLARANSAHTNSGTITATGGNLIVTQSGAPASFTNTGAISIGARTLQMNGGTSDFTAGSVTGTTGTFTAVNNTLSFTPATLAVRLGISSTTTIPHTITVPVGQTLHLINGTVGAPIVNNGTVLMNSTLNLTGAITNNAGAVMRVQGASGFGTATLTVTNGFTNSGTIELTSIDGGFASSMAITTGALTNAAGGSFNILAGLGGSRTFSGALINNLGTVGVGATWAANTALEQRNAMNVTAGTTTVSGASTFFSGSTTTLTGSGALVKAGGCTNSGGTGNGSVCP